MDTLVFTTVESRTTTMNMIDYIEMFPEIDVDYDMQSENRWSRKEKQDFIISCLTGKNMSKFVLANVTVCLEFATNNDCREYYQKWLDKGVKKLNVDSHNRTNTLKEFREGKIRIKTGKNKKAKFVLENGNEVVITRGQNDTYDTMPAELRGQFLSSDVTVEIISKATVDELFKTFRDLNKGKELNDAEKRNAERSAVSNTCRELANDTKELLKQANGLGLGRRKTDEFVAQLAYLFCHGEDASMTQGNLNKMYLPTSPENERMTAFESVYKEYITMGKVDDQIKLINNKSTLIDLFVIFMEMKKNNFRLPKENRGAFVKAFIEAHTRLMREKKLYCVDEEKQSFRTYEGLVAAAAQSNFNAHRFEALRKEFNYKSFWIELDTKRSGDHNDRLLLFQLQGGITPEGKEIDASKLYTGAYHIGHIIPHAMGGKSVLENFALQTAEDNLALGNNPIDMGRFDDAEEKWFTFKPERRAA